MYLFPVDGIPLMSLKAFIKVAAPASTAALNGGKYTSQSIRSLKSTELYSLPPTAAP